MGFALAVVGCTPVFKPASFTNNAELYAAALRERAAGREDNAIAAFERLQIQLSPSDSLLPRVHYQLGELHVEKKAWLLAGQAFLKIPENYPDDPLADDALLAAGDAYAKLWRRPDLDAKYGMEALSIYNLLIRSYPSSNKLTDAGVGAAKMREWLAQKDVGVGAYYVRRRAYDSALMYFNAAVTNFPGTDGARDALVKIVETYQALEKQHKVDYSPDIAETCAKLRVGYASDPVVATVCPDRRAPADSTR
jgi:outer membrane protein assembly factor BamD